MRDDTQDTRATATGFANGTAAWPDGAPRCSAGLTADQGRQVRQLIDRTLPGARVAVFGSRATGNMRPYSDLDLLFVDPPNLSWAQRADLRDAFEASTLPFGVDLVEAGGLASGMTQRVLAEAQLLP